MTMNSENFSSASTFTLLLFAGLRDAAGADSVAVNLAFGGESVALAKVLEACAEQHPKLAKWLPHIKVAVNCEYSQGDVPVKPSDEIALLPPVSGGEI
jgi:MoaE-MoaD fusion protein